jgi:nucleoside-diphosphate-sugar epimerase
MKILVTGGAGYVGAVLTQLLLDRGDRVRCYDRLPFGAGPLLPFFRSTRFELVRGDVLDAESLGRSLRDVDAVCHLAAIVGYPACKRNPEAAHEVNVGGARLLEAARPQGQPLVYACTGSVYGAVEEGICTEETPARPRTVYGRTKLAAENILLESGNAVSYRLATAFGLSPSLRLDVLVNDFCYQAARNHQLTVYGADARRTFIDVYDAARAFIHALDNYELMRGQVYNCGSERLNISKRDLVGMIRRRTDLQVHFAEADADEDRRDYEVSYAKLAATGFRTLCTLEDGIRQMLTAFKHLPTHVR